MRLASLTVATIMLTTAFAAAQNVTYDFDSSVDFSKFRTYAWVEGTGIPDQFNHARIIDAVNAQLAAKGLVRTERGANPDLLVAYHAAFDSDLRVTGFSNGWGPYGFGGARSGSARTEQIVTGTLVIDLVDRRTHSIVWRGVAAKEIDVKANPSKRERNINRAAERLFKNYPPAR